MSFGEGCFYLASLLTISEIRSFLYNFLQFTRLSTNKGIVRSIKEVNRCVATTANGCRCAITVLCLVGNESSSESFCERNWQRSCDSTWGYGFFVLRSIVKYLKFNSDDIHVDNVGIGSDSTSFDVNIRFLIDPLIVFLWRLASMIFFYISRVRAVNAVLY